MKITTLPMDSVNEVLQLQLSTGGIASLVVTGDSMWPTLRHRHDVVRLVPVNAPLKRGDLILYKRKNGSFILHRIISKPKEGAFFCCGDNQWEREAVGEDQVIARVDSFYRGSRECSANSRRTRAWVGFWVGTFFLRKPMLTLGRAISRIRRK